ncbi:MAG TPA: tRNA (adenosine(37)-N6)-dimethylallyltransferase MiaA [Usitatibacter sp.]|nr:tRNA (adenosine(37)-N6)-dimethylallyltransferase MiaA [Usitatibacter sp.]
MKAVFLLGPTASGKTSVALALGERFPAEIVSVDSAQVYRGMDIGTAKPDAEARRRVRHHLVDIVDPVEAYSAGRFRADAARAIEEIAARGRLPILAGGTMLYYRALITGLAELPPAQPAIRAEIERRAAAEGWPALHAELARVDAASAARIEPTDAQRIQRALEVHLHTGRPLSQLQREAPGPGPAWESLAICLEPSDRAALHERIAGRFRAMLAAGLVAELEALRARHALHERMPSMRTVGYRQAWETLEGRASAASLEARGIAATRQLAKRQLTWLRATPGLERFDALGPGLASSVARRVERFLAARSREAR